MECPFFSALLSVRPASLRYDPTDDSFPASSALPRKWLATRYLLRFFASASQQFGVRHRAALLQIATFGTGLL